jgi:hypothetical protein
MSQQLAHSCPDVYDAPTQLAEADIAFQAELRSLTNGLPSGINARTRESGRTVSKEEVRV